MKRTDKELADLLDAAHHPGSAHHSGAGAGKGCGKRGRWEAPLEC